MSPQSLVTVTADDRKFLEYLGPQLQIFRSQMGSAFLERNWLINQLVLALLCGRDTLVFGIHGAGKTAISDALFNNIVGPGLDGKERAEVFKLQLDNYTTKADLIGGPNIPLLREKGIHAPMVQGFLPTADFASFDELFDGLAVLRGNNDIFNERQLREGHTFLELPLLSAVATTQRSPKEVEQMFPALNLTAFNDRFLCVSEVKWIQEKENRVQMLLNYFSDIRFKGTLKFADIQKIIEIVQRTHQFPDEQYVRVYEDIIDAFDDKSGVPELEKVGGSRRMKWLTQLVEAEAIVQGRSELYYDDLYAVAYGLAPSDSSPRYKTFMQVAQPLIEKAKKAAGEKIDDTIRIELNRIETALKSYQSDINTPDWPPSTKKKSAIGDMIVNISEAKRELEGINPQLGVNQEAKERLLQLTEKLHRKVVAKT